MPSIEKAKASARVPSPWSMIASGMRLRMEGWRLRGSVDRAVDFPVDPLSVRHVLAVMPEEPLETVHSLAAMLALLPQMRHARIACACEKEVAPFLGGLSASICRIVYDRQERHLLSGAIKNLGAELQRERFDCAILLERAPDPALIYLLGRTRARLRIGFADAAQFPFLNVQIRCAEASRYRAQQYYEIAAVFGVTPQMSVRFAVSEKAKTEVAFMLKEQSIASDAVVVGVDGEALLRRCGRRWTAALVGALTKRAGIALYAYAPGAGDHERQWWREAGVAAVISSADVSHLAALVARSACVVGAKGMLFELGHLLHIESAGVFDKKEMTAYCASAPHLHGIDCDGQPDEATAERMVAAVDSILVLTSKGSP